MRPQFNVNRRSHAWLAVVDFEQPAAADDVVERISRELCSRTVDDVGTVGSGHAVVSRPAVDDDV